MSCSEYVRSRIKDDGKYYILLDEIQFAISREEIRNPDAPVKIYSVLMENIIFNELICRGYSVDVGVIHHTETGEGGKRRQKSCEIDFVVNAGNRKYYIQSALSLPTPEKQSQETRPLLAVKDFFQRIIISKTTAKPWSDEFGIRHIGLYDFLLNDTLLEQGL